MVSRGVTGGVVNPGGLGVLGGSKLPACVAARVGGVVAALRMSLKLSGSARWDSKIPLIRASLASLSSFACWCATFSAS